MLPMSTVVAKCPDCKRFYWIEEADVVGVIPHYAKPGDVPLEWTLAEEIKRLTIDEYVEALEAGVGRDASEERFLRVRFWWSVNDFVRRDPTAEIPATYAQKLPENLARLSALLDVRNPKDRLMKAEIARVMGDFAQVEELLEDVPEDLKWEADTLLAHSRAKNRLVAKLKVGWEYKPSLFRWLP
ncbi:MAG: hypothetical protein KF858_16840 [Candidatus Sumerlaeia bacterium]|nr:hypothetical protein [Candidatus Sumerlaeia bacterium]